MIERKRKQICWSVSIRSRRIQAWIQAGFSNLKRWPVHSQDALIPLQSWEDPAADLQTRLQQRRHISWTEPQTTTRERAEKEGLASEQTSERSRGGLQKRQTNVWFRLPPSVLSCCEWTPRWSQWSWICSRLALSHCCLLRQLKCVIHKSILFRGVPILVVEVQILQFGFIPILSTDTK